METEYHGQTGDIFSSISLKEKPAYFHSVREVTDDPAPSPGSRKWYKPFALRGPFLCGFLFLILVYIALLEIVAHHYPQYEPSLIPTPAPTQHKSAHQPIIAPRQPYSGDYYGAYYPSFYTSESSHAPIPVVTGEPAVESLLPTTLPSQMPVSEPPLYGVIPITVSKSSPAFSAHSSCSECGPWDGDDEVSMLPTTLPASSPAPSMPPSNSLLFTTLPAHPNPTSDNGFFLSSATNVPDVTSLISPSDYFIGTYSMVLAAILLRIVWTLVYNNLRMMEPFYQLQHRDGADGVKAFNNLYFSSSLVPEIVQSLYARRWTVVLAAMIANILDLFVSVAAVTLSVDPKHCHNVIYGNKPWSPCIARVVFVPWAYRLTEALLGFAFLMVLIFICFTRTRMSGICADPSSIAYMTSLIHEPHVVRQFLLADPYSSNSELKSGFKNQRYRLGHYRTTSGTLRYGVIPVDDPNRSSLTFNDALGSQHNKSRDLTDINLSNQGIGLLSSVKKHKKGLVGEMINTVSDISLVFVLLVVLAVVVVYYKDHDLNDSFNRFMNSGPAPRFVLTLIGSLLVSLWKRADRETRIRAAYHELARTAPAKALLATIHRSPWSAFPSCLFNGAFFAAFIALNAILSEVLTLALAGVPFNAGMFETSYMAHTWLSVSIASLMCLAVIGLFRRKVSGPRLPRSPDTLAGVWSFVAASHMRPDFEELSLSNGKEIKRTVKEWGDRYVFDEHAGVDGVSRLAIDKVHVSGAE